YHPRFGAASAACGACVSAVLWRWGSAAPVLQLVAVLLLAGAGFAAFFGAAALRKAMFPFALLLLMLPLPAAAIEHAIEFLRSGSTWLTAWMFAALGVPVFREGFTLAVPGVTIEVAKECSGINSSVALMITLLVAAHETLRAPWRKAVLLAVAIPLSIVKNAVRIVTLTMLALKVNPDFLYGRLHHEGGFVFFLITLAMLYPIWKLLQRGEAGPPENRLAAATSVAYPVSAGS
ncbi:MAG TPA: exosortase/archaeosortase family protein, partial [Terriglobales bacterium]|nr:exosortase/archaeosortase family protein [Terriglobales bacterium]